MYSPTWLVTFHRNAFCAHEINGKLFVYMGDFPFKIRARAVRHVIAITRELPLEQWLTFINRANPRKIYRVLKGVFNLLLDCVLKYGRLLLRMLLTNLTLLYPIKTRGFLTLISRECLSSQDQRKGGAAKHEAIKSALFTYISLEFKVTMSYA